MASLCVDPGSNGNFPFMTIGLGRRHINKSVVITTFHPPGSPVPTITLYQMGSQGQWTPVTDSRFAVTVSSVAVMGATEIDNGMYLINATNCCSSNQLTFSLNVSGVLGCEGLVPSQGSHAVKPTMSLCILMYMFVHFRLH